MVYLVQLVFFFYIQSTNKVTWFAMLLLSIRI